MASETPSDITQNPFVMEHFRKALSAQEVLTADDVARLLQLRKSTIHALARQ